MSFPCACVFQFQSKIMHDFAKYFDNFKMKFKFLTMLKDWNLSAQAHLNNDI